jgi:thiol-disulfide isomerase/thioredoxin
VFVFDAGRRLRYQGRIDDADRAGLNVKSHDTRKAIDALLAGQAPPVEKTNVFGCSTKWSDKRDDKKKAVEKWNQEKAELKEIDAKGVKELAANKGDDAPLRLVNVWATWCGPCLAEMPELVTMHRMYRKRPFELVTISTDDAETHKAAGEVLSEMHVSAKNYRFADENQDALVAALDPEGWQGPVPHTVLIAPGGKVLYRSQGEFDAPKLKRIIADHLGRTYASDKQKAR